ncbi:glycosyltransferase family 4 protein [Phormidium sp. LEGE 05292]|uniref:glycosyltransferase family 4 protein n=1 Tax=[Phormidium] sp. LEGE 05292 TaxID=767427 RepID=UPI00187ED120|nr:glycosyltransferase family 1 protein [Phormidium sp. LEGE 05292]MBE9224279.1 glycosyltransferase family 4 protein [Phormidium sp. LEGE 05292]
MTKETKINVTIDGYRLSYPATGLGLVTAELLRGFQELGYAQSIAVFVEKSFHPGIFELENLDVQWIFIEFKNRSPDYLGRLAWGNAVAAKLKTFGSNYRHFIPYLYNYGNLRQNVVLVPDLVYKIIPESSARDPNQPWWNLRGKLPIRPMFRNWEEWLVSRADRLVVYSEFVKNHVHEELGVPLEKMSLIPLATPSWVEEQYDESHNQKVQADFNLPSGFILYVGGFALRKNIPMLLRVCGKVYEADPSFRCAFVGLTESLIQNDYAIKAAMNNAAVRAAIIALPSLSYQDLASLHRLAEFSVYPSRSEGFGLPILEAAAAKRLCLCGDNSSMREIQTYSDFRIDSEDEEAWVEQILYFWQKPEEAKNCGAKCQNICQRYSWKKSAEHLWSLLNS